LLVLKTRELVFTVKSLAPLARFRPDVVHTHGVVTLVPGIVAKAALGSRLVVTIHSTTDAEYACRSRAIRRALAYADRIICVSGAVRDALLPALPDARIDVIPPAVDLECFGPGVSASPGPSARPPQLIAVGYFKPQKRYEDLVEAAAIVFARFPDHRLVIAGDGPERPRIEAMIEQRGLSDRIVLLGAVSQAELARHLRESRLFLMTSVSEGLPKAILEALACGTPIVVTTACNVNDIVDDVGTALPPLEPARFASAAIALLEDHDRWLRCATNAVAIAARYDWKAVAGRVRSVYEDALAA
jgi:glycosyltransferase involved in cell wall biosynthesis